MAWWPAATKWTRCSAASAVMCSRGSPVRNASRPAATASLSVSAAEPETMPIEPIRSGPAPSSSGCAAGHRVHARVQLGRGQRLGERPAAADERALVGAERLDLHAPELAREDRVVADLRMRVERQVVAGEVDVVLEQRPQAGGEQRRQPGRVEVPEQAVVDEHELGAQLDRPLVQLERRADTPVSTRVTSPRARHLQPVGPEVLEIGGTQQLVERPNDVVDSVP